MEYVYNYRVQHHEEVCDQDNDGSHAWCAKQPKPQLKAATEFKTKSGIVYLPESYAR